MTSATVRCRGCGGLVPDIEGPTHRYMLAAPGCWAAYSVVLGGAALPDDVPEPHRSLTVDAYAVQHPGEPNAQAIQSVWVHLITLHLALERDWPPTRLVIIRRTAADATSTRPWLEPPPAMGAATAIDVASAAEGDVADTVRAWVEGAWDAWKAHHEAVRARASALEDRFA